MRSRATAPRERLPWLTPPFAVGLVGGIWVLITILLIYWGVAGYYDKDDFRRRAVQLETYKVSEFQYQVNRGRAQTPTWATRSVYDVDVFSRETDRSLPAFLRWRSKWNHATGQGRAIWIDPRDVGRNRGQLPTEHDLQNHIRGWIVVMGIWFGSSWLCCRKLKHIAPLPIGETESP